MKHYSIFALAVILLFVAACVPKQPLVGGDRDSHGCIPSAGYTWCEAKQKCLRIWEEPCAPKDYCNTEKSSDIYQCGEYVKVVSAIPGEGVSYYTMNGTEIKCPVVSPEYISDECRMLQDKECVSICDRPATIPVEEKNQAIHVAKEYIMSLPSYQDEGGRDLSVTNVSKARCDGCWVISLAYELDTPKNSSASEGSVDKVLATVVLDAMDVSDVTTTRKTVESDNASFCTDMCGDGKCAEVVCMAQGCPCIENSENCPEDCK